MKSRALMVLLLVLAGLAQAQEWRDIRDDVDRSVPPTVRWYLEQRAENARLRELGQPVTLNRMPDSLNVRLVGKWGRGPANRVTGRDSLVFMSLGSEVAVFNCADASHPTIISEIQCRNITGRLVLKDSFLFVGANGPVEVYNIANLANPRLVCYAPVSGGELAIEDSLCYVLGVDSLYIYNITNPSNFQRVGACQDSGYNMCASDGFVYLCDRWGLYVIDATNPASPHQIGAVTGSQTGAVRVEGGLCYYTTHMASPSSFRIASVADPYHPTELGHLDGIGGYDIYKLSFFVYLPGFNIIDVSQPSSPVQICSLGVDGNRHGIWTRSPYSSGFVASSYAGLVSIDISDPVHPALNTMLVGAYESRDISVDHLRAYVAQYYSGMKIIDMSDPARPSQTGDYDTAGQGPHAQAVVAQDSFAYLITLQRLTADFRIIDVSDPSGPRLAATTGVWNSGHAAVIRDSLVYVAEDYKFEIFSIANPRSPRLVGSCELPYRSYDLCIRDSVAFVANISSLQIVGVANPSSPQVIGSCSGTTAGVAVKDSFAFVAGIDLRIVNIAHLSAPFLAATCTIPENAKCIAIDGNTAFVGECPYTRRLRVFDITNPVDPVQVGYYDTPDRTWRVSYVAPYLYVACLGAGVCILETTNTTGIAKREHGPSRGQTPKLDFWPNPAGNIASLRLTGEAVSGSRSGLFDMSGRLVKDISIPVGRNNQVLQLDLNDLEPGIYFAVWQNKTGKATTKLIKR